MDRSKGVFNFLRRPGRSSDYHVPSSSGVTNGNNNDNDTLNDIMDIPEPPPDPLELAVEENSRLQDTIRDLTSQFEDVKLSNMNLQSKADDLEMKLQLERRRVDWQKKFYEKKIVEVVLNGEGNVDAETLLESLSNSFYQEMIHELVAEQERKEGQIKDMKNSYQEQIRNLEEKQKAEVAGLEESHLLKVQQLVTTHEELIRDLLRGCEEGLFKEMKEEYLVAAESNVELRTTNGNKIWIQFQKLSSQKKGIIIASVCIITVATAGWASWGFITWVWPRLLIFADSVVANPQTVSAWATYLVEFLNSPQMRTFILLWEQGQPVTSCIKPFLNTALLASVLEMAPVLLSQLKNRRNKT